MESKPPKQRRKQMALTRKMLTGMGLTAEQVDAIIEEHADTVESLKEQRDNYKEQAEELKDVKRELNDLKQKGDNGAEWQKKYEALDKEYKEYKANEQAKATEQQVKDAYTKLLKENKISEKQIDSILNVTKFSDMKLDKDGNLEGADKLAEVIKERYGGFIVATEKKGADVSNPPTGGGTKYESKADIMKIKDTTERRKAIAENAELFNI